MTAPAELAKRLRDEADAITDHGTRRSHQADDLRAAAAELDRCGEYLTQARIAEQMRQAATAERDAKQTYIVEFAPRLGELEETVNRLRCALARAEAVADAAREYVKAQNDSVRGVWRIRAKPLADYLDALVAAVGEP